MTSPSEWLLEATPPPPTARIAYGPLPLQFGELRVPEGQGPHPLAIALHGGFWKMRYDLTHLGHACEALRQAGLATFSVEYRRVGDEGGGYPGTLEDVALAVDALPRLAAHGVAVDRVLVFGHSAGGQLALWLAGELRRRRGAGSPLAAVVSLAGVTDLVRGSVLKLSVNAVDTFMAGTPERRPEAFALASPIARLPIRVRQFLIHGEDDDTVPCAFSVDYVERARALGDDAVLTALPHTGHLDLVDPRSAAWPRVSNVLSRAAQTSEITTISSR